MKDASETLLTLLAREHQSLYALLYRITLDAHAAEDLLQELFLKLARTPGFAAAREPAVYLRRAAINLAFDWRKARRRRLRVLEKQAQRQDTTPPAVERLIQEEQWQRILDAVAALPGAGGASGGGGEAFVLHYLERRSFAEIAGQMGKTPHQVRALCHKVVQQLRQTLGEADTPRPREDSHVAE